MTMDIDIEKNQNSSLSSVDFDKLDFGRLFTDHMLIMEYSDGQWREPKIKPFGSIEISPALSALHYGQSVFEGVKAFATDNGGVDIFRLPDHMERLNRSCERMCIPTIPTALSTELVSKFVDIDREWVPKDFGSALYLRPFVFATDAFLGMRPSESYTFMVIASPVGPYYKDCLENPVKLLSSGDQYVRAVKGGTGEAKTSGNYAASMKPSLEAQQQGFTQVLWLDGKENKYIDEVGTMNIFFMIDGVLITPPLNGAVLDGITRRSVITLAKDEGIPVEERLISMDEIMVGAKNGSVTEAFGTGTAAVLSPIGEIKHLEELVQINSNQAGPFAKLFRDKIMSIQYGKSEDPYHWTFII